MATPRSLPPAPGEGRFRLLAPFFTRKAGFHRLPRPPHWHPLAGRWLNLALRARKVAARWSRRGPHQPPRRLRRKLRRAL